MQLCFGVIVKIGKSLEICHCMVLGLILTTEHYVSDITIVVAWNHTKTSMQYTIFIASDSHFES